MLAGSAAPRVPRAAIPEMKQAPKLDGVIAQAEWQDAVGNYGFVNHSGHIRLNAREARFWVGRRGETLYLAFRTEAPPGGAILTRVKPDGKRDLIGAFGDDSIEMVLDPKRGRAVGDRVFYHVIFNANGALYDFSMDPDNRANPRSAAWRISGWTMANTCHDGWWDVEVGIPFSTLDASKSDLATPWGVLLARNWKRPFMQSQWNSHSASYNDQGTMPLVVWDDTAPVVQVLSLRGEGQATVRVKARNPHAVPVDVAVYLQDAWHSDQHRVLKKTVTLAANSEQTFELSSPDGGPTGDHRTIINITSPDGKKTYYFRDFRWNLHRPKSVWQIGKSESKKVELKFKYYPYHNKIRVWVNARGLTKGRVTGAGAEVVRLVGEGKDRKPGKSCWRGRLAFRKGIAETIAPIPDLPDGAYRLVVKLQGKNVPGVPLVQDFARKHFEWEHNTLGISDKVIPPFTPLEVHGSTVQCVLRDLTHGSAGLWDRVVSQGKELLTGPMRWEVELADKTKPTVHGGGWKAVSRTETEVVGTSAWQAGPVRATLQTQYDYDGMMKCTLRLQPCADKIKRLTLRVPVSNRIAGFMHACGDRLRGNYAGKVPAGSGTIWDSSKGNKVDILGTFYPYLWVGDGERGVCWFADTDRDWILDDDTPVIDLVREGKTLWLNVHFITKASKLDREHTIVFGLQVTPTKPMPTGWRRWKFGKKVSGGRPVRLVGHSMVWGAHYYLPYPLEKDFSYFREMRRLREKGGQPDAQTKAYLDQWAKKVAKYIPEGSAYYRKITHHTRAGMANCARHSWKDGWRIFGYTNARGIGFLAEEFPVFQEEWLNYAFYHRNWDPAGAVAYDVTPSKSMTDCLLWYYREMLTCFEGVYWDNLYLSARHDPVVGDTWTDEKGRVHPGLGLFAMRDLVKRTAVFFAQQDKKLPAHRVPLITMGHMTNTQLVPILSFINCTFDWEWRYGYDDFQDRFTWDLTVAETIGRQVGAWPTILSGGHYKRGTPAQNKWVWRTRLGVCLAHEIAHMDYRPKADIDLYTKLFKFGYGLPACTVYNYWQEGHPAAVSSKTVVGKTLVISKAGAAIVVVTDYGTGGACRVKLDLAKLGLGDKVTAANFETGDAVKRVGPGEFELTIPKHDFRILIVK